MSDGERAANAPQDRESEGGINMLGMSMGVKINNPDNTIMEDDKAARAERSRGQIMNFLYALIGIGFIVFVMIFLRNDADLMVRVISIAISFLGGMGAGITIAKRQGHRG